MEKIQLITIISFVFLIKISYGINKIPQDNIIFLDLHDFKNLNEYGKVLLEELELFQNNVAEKLANRLLKKFDEHGLTKDEQVKLIQTFALLQTDGNPSKFKNFLLKLKNMAETTGKSILTTTIKHAANGGLKESMPYLERLFKNTMNKLPPEMRSLVAPLFFIMFDTLFTKLKIKKPAELTLEHFMYDGLNKNQVEKVTEVYNTLYHDEA